MEGFVQLNVGGVLYSIARCDVEKFPDSFFACLIKMEWCPESDHPICIARDGTIFRYVYSYLVMESLPGSKDGRPLVDSETVQQLKVEADFYGLTDLVLLCQNYNKPPTEVDLSNYLLMQNFVDSFVENDEGPYGLAVEHDSELIRALKPLAAPFCLVGEYDKEESALQKYRIYNKSTFKNIDAAELLETFAKSTESSMCDSEGSKQVNSIVEIEASKLRPLALISISNVLTLDALAPGKQLSVLPSKLVIHQTGCYQNLCPVLPVGRAKRHLGTLVLILNSPYTGGELEVTHGGRTEVVTGPYSWMAMYGDCLHKINPVTSGTRVSLIYDIYCTESESKQIVQDRDTRWFWTSHYNAKYFPEYKKVGLNMLEYRAEQRILICLGRQLANCGPDGVIIALQTLYPNYQHVDPVSLSAADRTLYDIINASNLYDVEIVTVIILRCQEEIFEDGDATHCIVFDHSAVRRVLGIHHNDLHRNTEMATHAKVFIPYSLDVAGLVHYVDENPQASLYEELVFITTCLHVRKICKLTDTLMHKLLEKCALVAYFGIT